MVMEQDIRFCQLDGRRIAYASVGEGPLLRLRRPLGEPPRGGVGDVPRAASSSRSSRVTHRVVRYDRIGAGLSDRELPGPLTPELETRQLEAVLRACSNERATLFACSCAGLATARFASAQPERGPEDRLLRRLCDARGHPGRDATLDRRLRPRQLAAGRADARGAPPPARQRRRDRGAQPLPAARRVGGRCRRVPRARPHLRRAAVPPAARDADARPASPRRPHGAHLTRSRARLAAADRTLHRALRRLAPTVDGRPARASPRTRRLPRGLGARRVERRLAADAPRDRSAPARRGRGLSNREIASSLVLSEHTVHRHVANILSKLTQSSRAAAATQAARAGYI